MAKGELGGRVVAVWENSRLSSFDQTLAYNTYGRSAYLYKMFLS